MPPLARSALLPEVWRRSRGGLAAIALFSLFINLLRLAVPIYLLQVLDRVIASRSYETLIMLTVITILAITTAVLLEIIRRKLFIGWGAWLEQYLAPRLFADNAHSHPGRTSSLSQTLRDLSALRSFVSGTGVTAWLDVFWTPLFLLCVWLISAELGVAAIVAVLLAIVLGMANERLSRDSRNATLRAGKSDRHWVDVIERNQDSVVSRFMMSNIADLWSRSSTERTRQGTTTRIIHLYFSAATIYLRRCLRVCLLGLGVWLVIDGRLTLGQVFAAGVLARTAFSLAEKAMLKWRDLSNAKNAYKRIKDGMAKDNRRPVSLPSRPTAEPLSIEALGYRYPQQVNSVFRGLKLRLNPGELLCVIGPSASGKTTLTRLISGQLQPRSGKVRLGEVDVARLQEIDYRRFVGHLSQQSPLFKGSVRENIASMAEGNMDQVVAAARLLDVHDTIMKLPQGYDTEIIENEPLLSQGQRKKIALARAFYAEPALIVLDEPLPHLDRASRTALREAIASAQSRQAVVVVTAQSRSLTRQADKILLLDGRKSRVLDTTEQIKAFASGRKTVKKSKRAAQPQVPRASKEPSNNDGDTNTSGKLVRLKRST